MQISALRGATVSIVVLGLVSLGLATATSAAAASPCDPSDLSAKVTGTAAGMSQPTTFITVTNTSDSSCTLKGYPTITRLKTKNGAQKIVVKSGAVMNAPQVPVKKLTLAPGNKAWFAIGTATAYDPPLVTFTKLAFALAADSSVSDSLKVKISQQATAPSGKAFPIGVTAFGKGTGTGD